MPILNVRGLIEGTIAVDSRSVLARDWSTPVSIDVGNERPVRLDGKFLRFSRQRILGVPQSLQFRPLQNLALLSLKKLGINSHGKTLIAPDIYTWTWSNAIEMLPPLKIAPCWWNVQPAWSPRILAFQEVALTSPPWLLTSMWADVVRSSSATFCVSYADFLLAWSTAKPSALFAVHSSRVLQTLSVLSCTHILFCCTGSPGLFPQRRSRKGCTVRNRPDLRRLSLDAHLWVSCELLYNLPHRLCQPRYPARSCSL